MATRIITAGELVAGMQVAERDGYLLTVVAVVRTTPKTITVKLASKFSASAELRAGVAKTIRKAARVEVLAPEDGPATPIRLEQWSVNANTIQWRAPEMTGGRLCGLAYGHPRHADGARCTTSEIASIDGRRVTTASGSVYLLGEPDPDYVRWAHGFAIDPENPIRG